MYVLSFDHIKYHNVSARLCSRENEGGGEGGGGRAQGSEPVKSRVPSMWFAWKKWDFQVSREHKFGAKVHLALLELSPV